MARIALRNLVTKPATRPYPYVIRKPYAATRGSVVIEFSTCIHCLACAKHCPADAIAVDRLAKSWSIDRFACVLCGACVRACPKDCLSMVPDRPALRSFSETGVVELHVAQAAPERGFDPASDA
jgi:formate hydrogenlyase subunit 6/NADH:ubiquinone oxidoreductase subunit I